MDASTGCPEVGVLLHEIDKQGHSVGGEVNVSVQRQQEGVLGNHLLPVHRDGLVHELEAQEVVHVHHLREDTLSENLEGGGDDTEERVDMDFPLAA